MLVSLLILGFQDHGDCDFLEEGGFGDFADVPRSEPQLSPPIHRLQDGQQNLYQTGKERETVL